MRILNADASNLLLPGRLADAWRASESFVVLPQPCPIASPVLEALLASLSPDLHHGHFALLTSGSTGEPKLVIGERSRAERLARRIHAAQALAPVRATVLGLPLSYSYAFVNQWLWSQIHEVPLVPTSGLADPGTFFKSLDTATDSMVCLVGSQMPLLRRLLSADRRFERVLRVNFAGGAFPQHELPWIQFVFPRARIYNNYGCTEALPRLAIRPAADSLAAACIGLPLPGVELLAGEDGALRFRSDCSAVAVVTTAGLHRFAPDEWIATGDLGRQDADGHWWLIGRASEVFKRHGEKISLAALMEVVQCAWAGGAALFTDNDAQGEPAPVLVLAPNATMTDVRTVLLALRARFRRPHWPIRVEATDELPLLPNGKPDVPRLRREANRTVLWRQFG